MANEFKHKTVGSDLLQAEWELADGTSHQFDGQATGDILYASSATVFRRLGIGTAGQILSVASGIPAWLTTLTGAYTFSAAITFSVSATSAAFISSSGNAATTGQLRLANADFVRFRNSANSANIDVLQLDGSDVIGIGNTGPNPGGGIQIGGASAKIGLYGAATVVQGAVVADASGGATVDAEARTAINAALARLRSVGLIAT